MSDKFEAALIRRIGERIRKIRKEKKITLIELSETTGVAQATLSRMENGQMMGTVESHRKIAEALGASLSHLYSGIDERTESTERMGSGDKKRVTSRNDSSRAELLIPNITSKKVVPTLITINAHGKTSMDRCERGVEKFLWVLEGEVKVVFDNAEYDLKTNDSFYFSASTDHQIVNTGSRQAKVMSVSSK